MLEPIVNPTKLKTTSAINRQYSKNQATIYENLKSGQLTAAELNDFSKWDLWKDIQKKDLHRFQEMWEISPVLRYAVQVKTEDEKPVVDATVLLKSSDKIILWSAQTDNTGKAELWLNLFSDIKIKKTELVVIYENREYSFEKPNLFHKGINAFKLTVKCNIPNQVDVAFVVDATQSMDDEIAFLKSDIVDIIQKTKLNFPDMSLNLGSVFYRCFGNSYAIKLSPFSNNIDNTVNFINSQDANEGGDEVVEEALKVAVDSLNWSQSARARLLFFVLDEQPLRKPEVINKLHIYIQKAAEKGIRIIPIVASAETPRNASSLEYLMRSMALATNGTYLFLTDHSKIGNAHAKPTTDRYDVELLNNLLKRIIYQFCYIPKCNEKISIEGISDTTYITSFPIIAQEIIDTSRSIKQKTPKIIFKDYTATANPDTLIQEIKMDSLTYNVNRVEDPTIYKKISLKFYPNPTSGVINVEYDGKINELLLTDISGKLISKFNPRNESKLVIDLGKYCTGIYFLKFNANNHWYSGKIILIR